MFVTYILRNSFTNRHYIGSTNNIHRRLIEHNRGQTTSTRQKGKWTLIYKEEFKTSLDAKRREKQLKSYKGGCALKRLLNYAAVVQR